MVARRIGRAAPLNDSDDAVTRGREAWQRRRSAAEWEDWVAIGRALMVGRQESMTKAKTNEPLGKNYNTAFHNWIELNGFGDFDKSDRAKLLLIMDDLDNIEKWRQSLTQTERLRWNHPCSVWRAYTCPQRGRRWQAQQANQHGVEYQAADESDGDENAHEPKNAYDAAIQKQQGKLLVLANKSMGDARDWRRWQGHNEETIKALEGLVREWTATLENAKRYGFENLEDVEPEDVEPVSA